MEEKKINVRALVLEALTRCEKGGYSNIALDTLIKRNPLSPSDRAFLTALFYGVIERKITLDYYIGAISSRSTDDIDPTVLNVLRLGACEILYMDSVPDYAAVNECVSLGRGKGERSFINGVLRAVVRAKEQNSLPMPKREKNLSS